MKLLYKFSRLFFIGGVILFSILSCNKVNQWDIDNSHNRLFSPVNLTASVSGVTVTLKWNNMPATNKYIVELSQDSLLFTNMVARYEGSATKETDGYSFVLPIALSQLTQYSARIKSIDTTGSVDSSKWTTVAFKTQTEQLMLPSTNLEATGVTLNWTAPNQVTHFMIGNARFDITPAESAAGSKTITGLLPKTAYSVTLYNGTNIRGTQSFTTTALIPTGPNVRRLDPTNPSCLKDSILALQAGENILFVAMQGSQYDLGGATVTIPNGASFTIWGEEGPNRPVITGGTGLTSQWFNLNTTNGIIKFENVVLDGANSGGTKATYLFNQTPASSTSKIVFENSVIRNFGTTIFRIQGSNTIVVDSLIINNCLAYNTTTTNYALIHASGASGSKVNNIKITNSTFYKHGSLATAGKGLILHDKSGNTSTVIDHCTFYDYQSGASNHFISFSGSFESSFTITNCIIANAAAANGFLAKSASITGMNKNGTYMLSDVTFTSNPIGSVSSETSAALFNNPDAGDFTFKAGHGGDFGSAGDLQRQRPKD